MSWFLLALLAPALDTIVVFVDKYVMEHRVKADSSAMPIYGSIASLVFGSLVWASTGLDLLDFRDSMILLTSGSLTIWGLALYFSALSKSHSSYITALLQTTPIFILILSTVFLNEPLNLWQVVGFLIVLASVLGLSVDHVEKRLKLDKSFYEIALANILFAVAAILIKLLSGQVDFASILAYQGWGMAIGGSFLFLAFRHIRGAFLNSVGKIGKPILIIMLSNEGLATFAQAVRLFAITLGPVALVGVLDGAQVFYALALGAALTVLFPKIFNEEINKRLVVIKVALSIILFVGIAIIGLTSPNV